MAAITQRLLRLRLLPRHHPCPLHHFSSSSDAGPPSEPEPEPEPEWRSQPSISSYFSEVKAALQRESPPQNPPQTLRKPLSFSNSPPPPPPPPQTPPPSKFAYLGEIRRNLSEFRSRTAPSPPSSAGSSISLQDLYNRHMPRNNEDSGGEKPPMGPSFAPIRESLRHLRSTPARNQSDFGGKTTDRLSLVRYKEVFKLKPGDKADQDSSIVGGTNGLPSYITKEMSEGGDDDAVKFVRMYNYSELGGMLQKLRPEKKKGNWFSLHELKERLAILRQIDDAEDRKLNVAGLPISDLRNVLAKLGSGNYDKKKKKSPVTMQSINILGQIGGTPSYMCSPPKDHLVEKYFHPDNMSSAEKMKLKLKKIRDEFKMSESDCGSTRVQIAQLTVKMNHLLAVLHKKDKHSKKGLDGLNSRRRKLLKYLRRTDWDSFCFVCKRLGIRDTPDLRS